MHPPLKKVYQGADAQVHQPATPAMRFVLWMPALHPLFLIS